VYDAREYMMNRNVEARKEKAESCLDRAMNGETGLKLILTKRQL